MLFIIFLYVLWIALGIVGVGHFVWSRCTKKIKEEPSDFASHSLLTLSILWLLGYFFYEGFLSLLSVTHLFYPVFVTALGVILSGAGVIWLVRESKFRFFAVLKKENSPFELAVLTGLCAFVFFWNIYPTFDVDSLASYFITINNFLQNGGRTFERFADVRLSMPLGENLLYAFGFALNPHSTLFAQLMHGVSKVMLILGVYGAARSLGAGNLALLAAALIASNEHIVASGANLSVRINVQLAQALFLAFFSLFIFIAKRRKAYLFLSLLAVLNAVSCKFLGLVYLAVILLILGIVLFLHKKLRDDAWLLLKKEPRCLAVLALGVLFLCPNYLYNWYATGSPFFPASIGPFQSIFYDPVSAELGRRFHYGITFPEALKNVTAFMVWPGILPMKMLFPLILLSGAAAIFLQKNLERSLKYGLCFSLISITMVLLQALYMTFEMRYYRFGIGIYALSCTLLVLFLFQSFIENFKLKKIEKTLSVVLIIFACWYCIRDSFDTMGRQRPSVSDIMDFAFGKKTEYQIIDKYQPDIQAKAANLNSLNIPLNELGVFVGLHWPHVYYPVAGYHLGLVQTAAVPSEAYFDEGLMADEFKRKGIRYIFNDNIILKPDDPWTNAKVYSLLLDCGRPMLSGDWSILELSQPCLDKWIAKKDLASGQKRLGENMARLRSEERYVPFNIPPFGGYSGIYR